MYYICKILKNQGDSNTSEFSHSAPPTFVQFFKGVQGHTGYFSLYLQSLTRSVQMAKSEETILQQLLNASTAMLQQTDSFYMEKMKQCVASNTEHTRGHERLRIYCSGFTKFATYVLTLQRLKLHNFFKVV